MKSRNNFGILLKSMGLNGNGIEIGVATGKYSKILLDTTELKKIYLLDAWKHFPTEEYNDSSNVKQAAQDALYEMVCKKVRPYGNRVQVIREDCTVAVNNFEDDFFDFVYTDANHMYYAIYRDLREWYPKVKKGGVFAGHDYINRNNRIGVCGVKKAVNEYCTELGIQVNVTGGTRRCPPSWYFCKK